MQGIHQSASPLTLPFCPEALEGRSEELEATTNRVIQWLQFFKRGTKAGGWVCRESTNRHHPSPFPFALRLSKGSRNPSSPSGLGARGKSVSFSLKGRRSGWGCR